MQNRPTLFVCESEPVAIAGLGAWLAEAGEWDLIGHASSPASAVRMLEQLRPSVFLMDHSAGIRAALGFLGEMRHWSESTATLLWTRDIPESDLVRAFRAGARGFVRKASPWPVLSEALTTVHRGDMFLDPAASTSLRQWSNRGPEPRVTPREREIIELVVEGLKNREIAERLNITAGTVKVHLMHVFEKTGVRDRYELAVRGKRLLLGAESPQIARRTA